MVTVVKTIIFICSLLLFTTNIRAADSHYELALQAYQNQEYDASYVYLKNALQVNPKNLPAKLLMGQLFTRNGFYQDAIKELTEALEFKTDIDLVLLPLGNVLTYNEQYQEVIDLGKGFNLNNETNFEWKMLSANAYSNLGKPELARAEYRIAARLFPKNTRVLNSLAFLNLSENKLDSAEKQAESSLKIEPNNHRTWHLKGKIADAKGESAFAIKCYRKALSIEVNDPVAKRSLAYALISSNQLEEAKHIAESIIKQTPDDPFAMLLNSWILSKNEQGELANNVLDNLSNQLTLVTDEQYNKQDSLLFVKGMSEYIQGNFEQARISLGKYVNKNRQDLNATAILAEIYTSMGQNENAIHMLERVDRELLTHLQLALKLADLYLITGKDFKAEYWLAELREAYPENIKIILMSSKALLARGKMPEAIKLIEQSSQKHSGNGSLLLARGFLYIQNNRFEDALKISNILIGADKRNVDYWNLKAASHLRLKSYPDAQLAIDSVLAISPNHFSGRFNQAMLLKNTGQFNQAKTLLNQLVEEQPNHSPSQFQLALVESVDNQIPSAIERLENIVILESRNTQAHILLLDLYLKSQQTELALRLVNKLVKNFPLEPEFSIKRAEVLIASRNIDEAKLQLTKLYNLWLDDPKRLFRLSSMQQNVNDYEGASQTLLKALTYLPKHLMLNLEYAKLSLQLQEYQKAHEVAERMQEQYGGNPNIFMLQGDIALAEGEYVIAHRHYMNAVKLENQYRLPLIRLYELARRGIKEPEFFDLISRLVEEQPKNNWRRKLLADHLMNQNKSLEAKSHYLYLSEQPRLSNEFSVLNNLANIYMAEDLLRALGYAKKAMETANTVPAVLDTYGWILTKLERFEEGLVSLRQAHAINSNDPAIRYHIGYTLEKLNRLAEAKVELQKSLNSESEFNERIDAETLFNTLVGTVVL
jgi:putative PEP-CTERM system TPR-repeat lipoprotein